MNKPNNLDNPLRVNDCKLLMLAIITLIASITFPMVIVFQAPRSLAFFGVFGLFAGPSYLLLSLWECYRYQRTRKALAAVFILALATVIAWTTAILHLFRKI